MANGIIFIPKLFMFYLWKEGRLCYFIIFNKGSHLGFSTWPYFTILKPTGLSCTHGQEVGCLYLGLRLSKWVNTRTLKFIRNTKTHINIFFLVLFSFYIYIFIFLSMAVSNVRTLQFGKTM